jgi:hypothetical protein
MYILNLIRNKWQQINMYAISKLMTNIQPNLINIRIIKCKRNEKKCKTKIKMLEEIGIKWYDARQGCQGV